MGDNYLVHYGILGQKWGERRFQNSDGSLTALGKVRYGVGTAVKKAIPRARILITKKVNRTKTIQEEFKEQSEKEKEEAKQKAIRSGNAREVLKYQDKMTTQELNDALNRVRNVTQLSDQAAKETKAAIDAANYNKASHKIARGLMKAADVGMKAAETVEKFQNAKKKFDKFFGEDDSKPDISKMTLSEAESRLDELKLTDIAKVFSARSSMDKLRGSETISSGDSGSGQSSQSTSTASGSSSDSSSAKSTVESSQKSEPKTESSSSANFTVSNNRSSMFNTSSGSMSKEERKDVAAYFIRSYGEKPADHYSEADKDMAAKALRVLQDEYLS